MGDTVSIRMGGNVKYFLLSLLVWASLLGFSKTGVGEEVDPSFGHEHVHVGVVAGVYTGWGWWGWGVPVYGYSYYPYWNYQPYYATFASIAYSVETGRYGVSYGLGSRWSAENRALQFCAEADCQIVTWVQGGCTAISRSEDGQVLGWGVSTTKYNARSVAQRGCFSNGGEKCRTHAWACSY